jgi:hypothetical protein
MKRKSSTNKTSIYKENLADKLLGNVLVTYFERQSLSYAFFLLVNISFIIRRKKKFISINEKDLDMNIAFLTIKNVQ